jgi:hypothetical protein
MKLKKEKKALDALIDILTEQIAHDVNTPFKRDYHGLLYRQYDAMKVYSDILRQRIEVGDRHEHTRSH